MSVAADAQQRDFSTAPAAAGSTGVASEKIVDLCASITKEGRMRQNHDGSDIGANLCHVGKIGVVGGNTEKTFADP